MSFGRAASAAGEGFLRGWRALAGLLEARSVDPAPRMPLVPLAAAVLCGGALGIVLPGGLAPVVGAWAAAAGLLVAWAWLLVAGRERASARVLLVAIGGAAAAWCGFQRGLFPREELAWRLDERPRPIVVEGLAVESPRLLPRILPPGTQHVAHAIEPASEFTLRVERVRVGSSWKRASGRASVVVDGSRPAIEPGMRVRVFGRGLRPSPALNPDEFDFREKARNIGCLSIVRCRTPDCVEIVETAPWHAISAWLDRVRRWGMRRLEAAIDPERADFAQALLLGSRESLPREESRAFLETGTVHILSISGLHVGILAAALAAVLRVTPLPRGAGLAVVAAFIGGYMLLVRAETPVVRATLVVWLACLGAAVGRRSVTLNSLAAAAIVVFLWRPCEVFRIGTQLSFLSTGVLVAAASAIAVRRPTEDPIQRLIDHSRPAWEKRLRRVGRGIAEAFFVGAAVWAATTPVTAAVFHVVSPVALLLNVVVAPLVAVAMATGFLCLLASTVSTAVGGLFGGLCDVTLLGVETCVRAGAMLPGGHAWVAGPPGWWVAGWYVLLAGLAAALPRRWLERPMPWLAAAGGWCGVGLVATIPQMANLGGRGFEMVAASLGHGLGVVVKTPAGSTMLYDAGRLGAGGAAARGVAGVLWNERVHGIDCLVLSHADTDHFNGVPELLDRFRIGRVVLSREFLESGSPAARGLLAMLDERGVPVSAVRAGQAFALDSSCTVRVLHPTGREPVQSDNESSLVLAVEASGRRLLLAGDIEGDAVHRLVARSPERCDVLVAPHHGTATSLPPLLAAVTRPRIVVVSGAGGPSWKEVKRAYAEVGEAGRSRVLKTGGEGAIRIRMAADALSIDRYTPAGWQPDRYRQAAATSSSMLAARKAKNSVWPPWPNP